jgi:hypothetical protein
MVKNVISLKEKLIKKAGVNYGVPKNSVKKIKKRESDDSLFC